MSIPSASATFPATTSTSAFFPTTSATAFSTATFSPKLIKISRRILRSSAAASHSALASFLHSPNSATPHITKLCVARTTFMNSTSARGACGTHISNCSSSDSVLRFVRAAFARFFSGLSGLSTSQPLHFCFAPAQALQAVPCPPLGHMQAKPNLWHRAIPLCRRCQRPLPPHPLLLGDLRRPLPRLHPLHPLQLLLPHLLRRLPHLLLLLL